MCDYSLHDVASRPAKVGDQLVTTKFNHFTRGLAAVDDPQVAVCLLPGTEIAFEQEAKYDHPFRFLLSRFGFDNLGERVARFRQVNVDQQCVHHDALEFPNGRVMLLTRLCPGQRATVLQLPVLAHPAATDAKQTEPAAPVD